MAFVYILTVFSFIYYDFVLIQGGPKVGIYRVSHELRSLLRESLI